jgi:hypothetical protein
MTEGEALLRSLASSASLRLCGDAFAASKET